MTGEPMATKDRRQGKWMDKLIRNCLLYLESVRKDHHLVEIFNSSVLTFLLRFGSFALVYLLHYLIATIYGSAELGIFNLALTILEVGLIISMLGIDTAAIRFLAEYHSQRHFRQAQLAYQTMIKLTTITSIMCSLILLSLAEWLALLLFHQQSLAGYIRIIAVALPFMVLSRIHASVFRALKKMIKAVMYEVIIIRLGHLIGLMAIIIWVGPQAQQVMYTFALAIVISMIISLWDWQAEKKKMNQSQLEPTPPANVLGSKQLLTVSIPMLFTSSMTFIMGWTDIVLLGIYYQPEVVGVYSIVLKLSVLTSFAYASINSIILPKFSELYWKNEISALQKVVQFSNCLLFWLSAPVLLVIACFAKQLLAIFGEEFIVGSTSLIILCIGQFTSCVTGNVIALLNMTGHQNKAKNALLLSAGLNIVGNCLLIPLAGIVGAAIATSISMIVRDVMATYYASKVFGFKTWYMPWNNQQVQTG